MHPFQHLQVPKEKVGIHWFGQNSFALKDPSGIILHVDPYFPRDRPPDQFIHSESPLDEATLEVHHVLVTHDHLDHTCIESLLRIHKAFPTVRFHGPSESTARMRKCGIPASLLHTVAAGERVHLETITAHVVLSKPAAGSPKEGINAPDVWHFGYVLEIGPVCLYISGDPIGTFANHDELIQPVADLKPDIGLLTTQQGQSEFPDFQGSVDMAIKLNLKAVVPAHYDCYVGWSYDPQAWAAAFPEDGPTPIIIPYNESILYPRSH